MAQIHEIDAVDLKFNKSNTKPLQTLSNIKKLLHAHRIPVRFNIVRKDLDIEYPGIETKETNKLNRMFAEIMSMLNFYNMSTDNLGQFLLAIGDEFSYNPIADWIESTPWDQVTRLQSLYDTIEAKDNELKEMLIKRWMIGAIAAVYQPDGVSAALVLVLQGEQYLGKTNWFKNLVSGPARKYAKDGLMLDPKDKDSVYICVQHWLVELGEIQSTFKKSDLDALKAFITSDRDIIRLPYGKAYSRFPRQTVFFGSVNEESYLADKTGNRRFATIACKNINHTHGLDMQQVWAELKCLYDLGESWYLSDDELSRLNEENTNHEVIDPIEEKILSYYEWDRYSPSSEDVVWKNATQVLEDVGYRQIDKGTATRAGAIVLKLNKGRKSRNSMSRLLALPYPRIVGVQ